MMKKFTILACMGLCAAAANAQSPIDAYSLSQYQLRGTARFMSMAGAFGALGGDLSTLSQNPAGIGVYRSGDVGLTVALDCDNSKSNYFGYQESMSRTKFHLNNIGVVGTLRLNSNTFMNLNLGFTYNKGASFNRRYSGGIPQLKTSLSNYIAGIANNYGLTEADVRSTDSYDPYNPGYGDRYVPWAPIIGYDSYLINPEGNPQHPVWQGQFGNGTTGSGYFEVEEYGSLDEYNIALGGNIANKVFWGMNFDIVSVDYNIRSLWQESLNNAYVFNPNFREVDVQNADWAMDNLYNMNGTGFNYQLGVIVKPIQELRLGFAFHTPTWYNLTENYYADQVDYRYNFEHNPRIDDNTDGNGYALTNDGIPTYDKVKLTTPWKIIASVAGVIGTKGIVSFDYEWQGYKNMRYHQNNSYFYDFDYDYNATPEAIDVANESIRTIYRNTSTFRVGAEYRIIPQLSVRLGYSYTTSPVTDEAKHNMADIPATGTLANYRLDNSTQYVTAGLGFHTGGFYVDAAYVYKHLSSTYTPFSPDPEDIAGTAMTPSVTFNNSQIVLTAGYKF